MLDQNFAGRTLVLSQVTTVRYLLAWIFLLTCGGATLPGAVLFENFASAENLSLVGDASVSGKSLRLTEAHGNLSGAAWFRDKQSMASGFETTFDFQLTHQGGLGHGADGFAFALQNAGPQALGGRGSAGGFAVTDSGFKHKEAAIPWSIAIFFDTFKNGEDPSDNYIALCTYGKANTNHWPAPRLAFTPKLAIYLRDENVHSARILFQPPRLSVYLDNSPSPVLESVVDLAPVLDEAGKAWVGFTASTGGGYQNHDILNWSFTSTDVSSSMVSSQISFMMSACLPNRNLCTPETAVVERRDAGYHVILPGNLQWGASLPTPAGRNTVITNDHGIVCEHSKTDGSDACSGPAGKGTAAGVGFLVPDAPAGALVTKTEGGQTRFSVNGHIDNGFKANEGFYEFDVAFQ